MQYLNPSIQEIAPPSNPDQYRQAREAMISGGMGPLTVHDVLSDEKLGETHLGGDKRGVVFVIPAGVSSSSGGELYKGYHWTITGRDNWVDNRGDS